MEFKSLAETFTQLEKEPSRLHKTQAIARLLKSCDAKALPRIILLLQGLVLPKYSPLTLGIATNMAIKAIARASGHSENDVMRHWKKTGDLGESAKDLHAKKRQSTLASLDLSVSKVFENLKALATISGKAANDNKLALLAELLTSASGDEAKFIIRLAVGDLRVGVGDGALRDALVWAFLAEEVKLRFNDTQDKKNDVVASEDRGHYNEVCDRVTHAYHLCNDFTIVAEALKRQGLKGLDEIALTALRPLQVMLCQRSTSIENAFNQVGTPAIIEYKYDGFRVNIHKKGNKIALFTRRLEDVTKQFPDVVRLFSDEKDDFIIDAEIMGYDTKTKRYLPFQQVSTRIRRKYDIDKQAEDIPVKVICFDILWKNEKSQLEKDQKERRVLLKKTIKPVPGKLSLSTQITTSDEKKAASFYKSSLDAGNEGVIFKALDKPYRPGSRVGFWVKYKPVMQELDLVITKAQYGEGKRAGWFSSFTIACLGEDDELLDLGNVGTGIKEKASEDGSVTFEELTTLLRPLIKSEKKNEVTVRPKIVVEIAYEEIQRSTAYSSGYALRFPRVMRLRDMERSLETVDRLSTIEDLYNEQRGRNRR